MKLICFTAIALLFSAISAHAEHRLMGADLSYVNEMEDCGAVYTVNGKPTDPYKIFKDRGADLIRLRLWHTPDWTHYSTLADVKKSIARAKALHMQVLLAMHLSDDWADPQKQAIPKAWAEYIDDTEKLSSLLYDYIFSTLIELHKEGLLPDIVQVGNEINGNILREPDTEGEPIDWARNSILINSGIKAIRDVAKETGADVKILLHIAQPENAERWFAQAAKAGVTDFDYIGISFYEKWSERSMSELGETIKRMKQAYSAEIVVAETSYPWTMKAKDEANNILGEDSLAKGYPATKKGQKKYLIDLTHIVINSGGSGVLYWEPAWVSTSCKTRWGKGSHWENATLFDFDGEVLEGFEFLTSWKGKKI